MKHTSCTPEDIECSGVVLLDTSILSGNTVNMPSVLRKARQARDLNLDILVNRQLHFLNLHLEIPSGLITLNVANEFNLFLYQLQVQYDRLDASPQQPDYQKLKYLKSMIGLGRYMLNYFGDTDPAEMLDDEDNDVYVSAFDLLITEGPKHNLHQDNGTTTPTAFVTDEDLGALAFAIARREPVALVSNDADIKRIVTLLYTQKYFDQYGLALPANDIDIFNNLNGWHHVQHYSARQTRLKPLQQASPSLAGYPAVG